MSWFEDIQGIAEVQFGATAVDRKHILRFPAGSGENQGDVTVVFPDAPYSISGTTAQEQIDSIVAALVALGLATDDRP
jgi:hypothetical protein